MAPMGSAPMQPDSAATQPMGSAPMQPMGSVPTQPVNGPTGADALGNTGGMTTPGARSNAGTTPGMGTGISKPAAVDSGMQRETPAAPGAAMGTITRMSDSGTDAMQANRTLKHKKVSIRSKASAKARPAQIHRTSHLVRDDGVRIPVSNTDTKSMDKGS